MNVAAIELQIEDPIGATAQESLQNQINVGIIHESCPNAKAITHSVWGLHNSDDGRCGAYTHAWHATAAVMFFSFFFLQNIRSAKYMGHC